MRALVVDDEFVALTKMVSVLNEFADCDAATCGEQAFDMFSKALGLVQGYDLVTLDIQMPGIDGLTLLERLVREENLHQVTLAKKIVISAASTPDNVTRAVRGQCDAFMVKPIKRDDLVSRLVQLELITEAEAKPTRGRRTRS